MQARFFVYVLAIRTYDVATTFLMLGEQTRDWTIALGGITDLPLTGAPSTAGGRGFGPVYYWLLWIGRVTIGPFMDNLPHAGGVTVALLQSIADVWLFVALSRRDPLGARAGDVPADRVGAVRHRALVVDLESAGGGGAHQDGDGHGVVADAGLTDLARGGRRRCLAWMAVQCHLSAIFVAAPLLAALRLSVDRRTIVERRVSTIVERSQASSSSTVLVLQIPFFISILREPSAPAGPDVADRRADQSAGRSGRGSRMAASPASPAIS